MCKGNNNYKNWATHKVCGQHIATNSFLIFCCIATETIICLIQQYRPCPCVCVFLLFFKSAHFVEKELFVNTSSVHTVNMHLKVVCHRRINKILFEDPPRQKQNISKNVTHLTLTFSTNCLFTTTKQLQYFSPTMFSEALWDKCWMVS